MYNATNAATWLWAPQRLATRLRVLRRASIQLNDLFVTTQLRSAPLLATRLGFWQRTSTQRFVCQFILASSRSSTRLPAAQRNSTICLSIYYRASTRLSATNRGATRRAATRSNATQRFVYQFILRNSAPHNETQQTAA